MIYIIKQMIGHWSFAIYNIIVIFICYSYHNIFSKYVFTTSSKYVWNNYLGLINEQVCLENTHCIHILYFF